MRARGRAAVGTSRCSRPSCSELLDPQAGPDRDRLHLRRRRSRAAGRRASSGLAGRSWRSTAIRWPRSGSRRSRPRSPARCASSARGYAEALELLAGEGVRADAVYFDLGMSSMQVDTRERGFSYSYDAPLDMRMDPRTGAERARDRRRLGRAQPRAGAARLRRGAPRAARSRGRSCGGAREAPIETTQELVDTISAAIPAPARFAGGHPAKRSFQALRIAVNDELGQLDRALPLAWELLRERRRARRDRVPLARGPARQALPRRARARLHLPAGAARVRRAAASPRRR